MKKKLILFWLILLSINCFAQNNISIRGLIGICDLRYINPSNVYTNVADYYSPSFSFKAGIYYDLIKDKPIKLFPTIGLSFTGKAAKNSVAILGPIPLASITTDRFYSCDLPVELNYILKDGLVLKGGINTSLIFANTNHHGPTEIELLTLGILGGISFINRNYSINLEFIYDVTDMLKYTDMDMSYKCALIHVGIGYYF